MPLLASVSSPVYVVSWMDSLPVEIGWIWAAAAVTWHRSWAEKQIQTSPASYLGLDFSSGLLAAAAKEMDKASPSLKIEFQPADLLSAHWSDGLPVAHFDIISAFAVLHHIPGSKKPAFFIESGAPSVTSGWQVYPFRMAIPKQSLNGWKGGSPGKWLA